MTKRVSECDVPGGNKAKGRKTRSGTKTSGKSGKKASGKSGYSVKREQQQQEIERLQMHVDDLQHRIQQQALVNAANVRARMMNILEDDELLEDVLAKFNAVVDAGDIGVLHADVEGQDLD